MAAPTFIQEAESAWTANANDVASVTTDAFDTLTGDVVVVAGITSDWNNTSVSLTVSNNGSALTWAQKGPVQSNEFCWESIWTTVLAGDRSGLTTTVTRNADSERALLYGLNALTFRDSDGVGAEAQANDTGTATVDITTTQDNSAVVVFVGDWNAVDGTIRGYETGDAGAATEVTYFRDSSFYTIYGAYYADAGTAGTKTVGVATPGTQKFSIVAVEILGTAGGGGEPVDGGPQNPSKQLSFAPPRLVGAGGQLIGLRNWKHHVAATERRHRRGRRVA